MDHFSKVLWGDASSLSNTSSDYPRALGVVDCSESQHEVLDGSDPTTTTSNSLDRFKSEIRTTLATFATLDNGSLVALSKDDEYLGILKQLVGPLALNESACRALVGHIEALSTESEPEHHFTIHFSPNTVLSSNQLETKQRPLVEIVDRNIATEVKDSAGQHIVDIKPISSPPSLICSTHSPTLGRLLQPSIYRHVPNIILSNQSPNIFKDSHLANHGWWVRPEGEELYILHFVYMSTDYLKAGTSTYLEAAIRQRYFKDVNDSDGRKMGEIPIGAMRWRFVTPDCSLYSRPVHLHRYYEGWEAWFQVGLGKTSWAKEWLHGKEKFEMRVPNHNNYESRVDVEVIVYRD